MRNSTRNILGGAATIGIVLLFVSAIVARFIVYDGPGATATLTAQGYTEIVITGARPLSGSDSDFYNTGFTAVSPNGTPVSGVVSRGLFFKGSTVRMD